MTSASPDLTPGPFSNLWQNALCVILTLHKLGIKRTMAPQDVLAIDTDETLIRVTKSILSCSEYQAILKLYTRLRSQLARLVLPSTMRAGIYLIPLALTKELDDILRNAREELDALVSAFTRVYAQRVTEDQLRLKDAYNTLDYPDVETVRNAFSIEAHYITWDLPATLSMVSESLLQRESANAQQKLTQMLDEVNDTLRQAMAQLVNHLVSRLTPDAAGQRKTFRASTITNLMEFLNRFDARNLGNDTALQEIVRQAKTILSDIESPKALRTNQSLAEIVQKGMVEVQSQLDSLLVRRPSRLYSLEEAA